VKKTKILIKKKLSEENKIFDKENLSELEENKNFDKENLSEENKNFDKYQIIKFCYCNFF